MSAPRKVRCAVESVVDHGGQVYTVNLLAAIPVPVFRPGQFLHLAIDDYDPSAFWPESRVFSIASSPRCRTRLRICYSVKGSYTGRMEKMLKPGREVWIKLPYGDFQIDPARDTALLAGGTGISAFTAFLAALEPEKTSRVTLVYGARRPGLFLFKDMILAQLIRLPNLNVMFFSEEPDPCFHRQMAALRNVPHFFDGRISIDLIWSRMTDAAHYTYYVSGPPAMLKVLTADLISKGVPPEQVRSDAWE